MLSDSITQVITKVKTVKSSQNENVVPVSVPGMQRKMVQAMPGVVPANLDYV